MTHPKNETPRSLRALSRVKRAASIWSIGGITGSGTSLSFILIHNALTVDLIFELWEFGVAIMGTTLLIIAVTLITRAKIYIVFPVAYLTLIMPVSGAFFGSSGSEGLWQFALLGMVGGLVWSMPFATWAFAKSKS